MSALTDLSELVGFFSYSHEDDEDSEGGLSQLRDRIQRELSSQLGRSRGDFRLWQDRAAIAHGTFWENEIKSAIAHSVFFIPIITPRAVRSRHCGQEFDSFIAREAELGRDDLVFPILYIPVPALEREELWRGHPVLKIIGSRQYLDWTDLRHRDTSSTEVRLKAEQFCRNISNALRKQWLTPEEQRQRQEAEAQHRAEEEQQRAATVTRQHAGKEEQQRATAAATRQRADEEQQPDAAEARRRAEQEQKRAAAEADAAQRAQQVDEVGAAKAHIAGRDRLPSPLRALLAGSALIAIIAIGAAVWMLASKPHTALQSAQQQAPAEAEIRQRADQEEQRAVAEAATRQRSEEEQRRAAEEAATQQRAEQEQKRAAAEATAMRPQAQSQKTLKPMDTFADCSGCPQMVVLAAGQFMMGSPKDDIDNGLAGANEAPQHKVVIAQPIAVGRFEITRDQFEAFVDATGYMFGNRCYTFENNTPQERPDRSFRNPGFAQTGTNPAVCVSWSDAKAYVAWLAQSTGKLYRLLSESEWEYAARAGSASRYGFGDDAADLCEYANGADQSAKHAKLPSDYAYMNCTDSYAYTAPVGSFKANAWSLSDFLGNVWELTEDCYAADYTAMPADGSAREAGDCSIRTARGGSWFSNASSLRPAVRAGASPDERHDDLGFRVARSLTP